jgi:hypothetical protein
MVTWANNHYFDFVRNWVEHVETLGVSSYVIGAMDDLILAKLVRAGMPCFAMQSGLIHKDFGWGSKQFHKMVRCCILQFPKWLDSVIREGGHTCFKDDHGWFLLYEWTQGLACRALRCSLALSTMTLAGAANSSTKWCTAIYSWFPNL